MALKMNTIDVGPLTQPGTFAGGVLIKDKYGEPIGVSAGSVEQDHEVAAAGAAAY